MKNLQVLLIVIFFHVLSALKTNKEKGKKGRNKSVWCKYRTFILFCHTLFYHYIT